MKTRTERRVAARYRWDRLQVSFWFAPAINDPFTALTCPDQLAESQAGELIEQDRQTIYLSSQALQTKLGDTASSSFWGGL